MTNHYRIANKNVQINNSFTELNEPINELLNPYITDNKEYDYSVNIITQRPEIIYSNPSVHYETEDGFGYSIKGYGDLFFEKTTHLEITFIPSKQLVRRPLYKRFISSGEYSSLTDLMSSLLFEHILVCATFFFDDIAIVHSAGFKLNNNRAILIGGTGGIGKTSLEIQMCFNDNTASFINDDIAFIDQDGFIYPNYARPKIYGYNLNGNSKLEKEIFKTRTKVDRLAWHYKKARNGITKVRRRVTPLTFNAVKNTANQATDYWMMSRHNSKSIEFQDSTPEQIASLTNSIIHTEYSIYYNHLIWHNYNKQLLGEIPILDTDTLDNTKLTILQAAFEKIDCKKVLIPKDISHKDYLQTMGQLLSK